MRCWRPSIPTESSGRCGRDWDKPGNKRRAGFPPPHVPDLAAVVAPRPELPEAIRAGILAMVKAASGSC
jgi:hypothetical protein